MRDPVRDKGRLEHILESVNNIYEFAEGYKPDQILTDKVRYFAIVYQLVVIGEAANLLTNDFRMTSSTNSVEGNHRHEKLYCSWIQYCGQKRGAPCDF